MNITTKIYFGFAAVLILLAVVAFFGVRSLSEATDTFEQYRGLARQTNADGRVQANMLMTRIFAKNFVINATDENIKGVKERAERTLEMIDQANLLTTGSDARKLLVEDLQRDLKRYVAEFDKVTQWQAKRNDLVENHLNVLGPETERALTRIMNSALKDGDTIAAHQAGVSLRSLLLGRLYANRFLIKNDDSSVDRAMREFRDLELNIEKLLTELENPERRKIAENVKTLQAQYMDAFIKVRRVIGQRNTIIQYQLDRIGPAVADRTERLKLSIKKEQDTLGPKAQKALSQAENITTMASVGAVIVGAIIATLIASGVSGPIRSITTAAQAMAAGDLDQDIDTKRSDEVGTLAKAFVAMRKAIDDKVSSLETEINQRKTTEEKLEKARNALRDANETLEEKVRLRTLELEEKDAQLHVALGSMSDGIYTVDSDLKYTMFNERYIELTGLPRELFEHGKSVEETLRKAAELGTFGEGDIDEIVAHRLEVIKSEGYGELESFTPDGKILSARKSPLNNGGAIVVVSDVTERRKAEQELSSAFRNISSSINYASKIQKSILPHPELLIESFDDHFVYWEPRDVVGGDIYWFYRWGEGALFALGDCTGHGVPGAFMTLISTGALERAMSEVKVGDLSALLKRMHELLRISLGQSNESGEADDGLELGVCYIDDAQNQLKFGGAKFDLLVVDEGKVERIQGSRKGLGYREIPLKHTYETEELTPSKSARFYMTTDGAVDQISSNNNRRLGKKAFNEMLLTLQDKPMKEQAEALHNMITEHQGAAPRLDDMAIVGFKVG